MPAQRTAARAVRSSSSRSATPSTVSQHSRNPTGRQVHWGADQIHVDERSYENAEEAAEIARLEREQAEAEAELNADALPANVLAITASKGRVGCCYLDLTANSLYFLEDQRDSAEWDLCSLIVEQLLPTFVLTSTNADDAFLQSLEDKLATLPLPPATSLGSTGSNSESADLDKVRIEYRPARDFYSTAGKYALSRVRITQRATGLSVPDGSEAEAEQDHAMLDDSETRYRELRLESLMNNLSANPLTLGCAGALLDHVSSVRSRAGDLESHVIELNGIELLRLDKIMLVNWDALLSLQIFRDEAHASAQSRATKEGLSLYGVAGIAKTPLGKAKMRDWFLRPSLELDVIEERHDAVECFLREDNLEYKGPHVAEHVVDTVKTHLKMVKNTPIMLKRLMSGSLNLVDWQTIWQLLYATIMIRDALLSLTRAHPVVAAEKFAQAFDATAFRNLASMLNDVIDWDEAKLQHGRFCVRSGVDEALDELRRKYGGLSNFLSNVAAEISNDLTADLPYHFSTVYFPQLGYLVAVPQEEHEQDPARFAEMGWDFQFLSDAQAYYKDDKCRDLDRYLGDLQSFIADKEIEIAHALLEHVTALRGELLDVTDKLAEIDCLLAFAEAARLYNWKRPVMTNEPMCQIFEGRHPLAELCAEHFVPNNTALLKNEEQPEVKLTGPTDARERTSNMLILTGANFSGKSIYLKQVALIIYMAQIGCFVPASDALIGLTDRIMTRISTRESITRGSSAFMIDLQQISFALRNCTARSLLVVDEFGKGTEADDGAGLFCGLVEYLLKLGAAAPRAVLATHFQHVFLNGVLSRQSPFVLAHMEVFVNDTQSKNSETATVSSATAGAVDQLTYLYRLAPGLAVSSNALSCASMFGIPPEVLSRAAFVTDCLSTFQLDKLMPNNATELDENEQRELAEAEEIARRFLEWDLGGDEDGDDSGALDAPFETVDELRQQVAALLDLKDA